MLTRDAQVSTGDFRSRARSASNRTKNEMCGTKPIRLCFSKPRAPRGLLANQNCKPKLQTKISRYSADSVWVMRLQKIDLGISAASRLSFRGLKAVVSLILSLTAASFEYERARFAELNRLRSEEKTRRISGLGGVVVGSRGERDKRQS